MSTARSKRRGKSELPKKQQANTASMARKPALPASGFNARIERHPTVAFLLVSTALVLLLYWRSFTSPFVYDDLDQIVNNPNLTTWGDFTHRFLLRPVRSDHLSPEPRRIHLPSLFWLTLFLDRATWGLNPGGFHATNLALHLANGNLALLLLRRLKQPLLPAAIVALVWLALPINTEVVAWISGRSYALCTLFVLACLLSALSYLRQGKASLDRRLLRHRRLRDPLSRTRHRPRSSAAPASIATSHFKLRSAIPSLGAVCLAVVLVESCASRSA